MLDNDAKFKASGGSVVTGDQITKKEAEAQVKRLEAESESVFPPSTETGRHGLVPPAIAAQNKVYRMPDGPEKDLARKEVDLMFEKQDGIEHTISTVKLRKDQGLGGQDVATTNNFYAKNSAGEIVGGATALHYKNGTSELFMLGSTGSGAGAGSAVMRQFILDTSTRSGNRIVIRAESQARPFYRAMGFEGDMIMTMKPEVIQQIAEAIR
jgi:hypothetical protein